MEGVGGGKLVERDCGEGGLVEGVGGGKLVERNR
jgi:hypothetical protein